MKNYILLTVIILCSFIKLNAQNHKVDVFEGKMNDKMPITLYLESQENECTVERFYKGMYKYNGKSKWLQLDITKNDKMQFVLIEHGFTGLMILEKTSEGFDGVWVSPDAKKQLKVEFNKVEISNEKIKTYEDIYENVNYENNDC